MCDKITTSTANVKTDSLSANEILSYSNSDINILCFDTIDSTNLEAKRRADENLTTPLLIVANSQSAGRGRLGRSFYSPSDTGLYMSLMLKPDDCADIVCMTTAAAVCVTDALEKLCNIESQIKWVNDIYINNKKVCGILCEAVTNPKTSRIEGIIIGIGINISTDTFPSDIKDIAVSLKQYVDRNKLCAMITDNLINTCTQLSQRNFIEKYKARSLVLGKEITYTENGINKTATAIDIDKNGGLVIRTEDGTKTLSTGEITVRVK